MKNAPTALQSFENKNLPNITTYLKAKINMQAPFGIGRDH
jgi:hypothetical protein